MYHSASNSRHIDFRKHGVIFDGKLVAVKVEYTIDAYLDDQGLESKHFAQADRLFPTQDGRVIDGIKYTWHHLEGLEIELDSNGKEAGKVFGIVMLVRKDVHNMVGHDGGMEQAAAHFKEKAKALGLKVMKSLKRKI